MFSGIRNITFYLFVIVLLSTQGFSEQSKIGDSKHSQNINPALLLLVSKLEKIPKDSRLTVSSLAIYSNAIAKVDHQGKIQTYIRVRETSDEETGKLQRNGAIIEIINRKLDIFQAWLPFEHIRQIAADPAVLFIQLPDYAVRLTGSVNSEGDEKLKADQIRNVLGKDGSGVRVGVISNGVDSRADARVTNDLPQNIDIKPDLPGAGDEGTAMLEIIHDLAPGAQLAFAGPETGLEMLEAIDYLAHQAFNGLGCDIIVDDLGFLSQPAFEDGPLAQAVDTIVDEGITYFTAVGNQAQAHYETGYESGILNFNNSSMNVHDFGRAQGGASDVGQGLTIGANAELTIILQWNDPFAGSNIDYDLLIFNSSFSRILAISELPQDGQPGQSPIEIATFMNETRTSVQVNVVVRNFGALPSLLEIFYIGEDFKLRQFNMAEGSVVPGQQMAKGAIAVGAIYVNDPGVDTIERFSSHGPVRIFFPTEEVRIKPDIVAVDGVAITGAGGFGSNIGGVERFFGTSAAAPHAAAVAALLLSGAPNLTPADIRSALQNTAVDLGATGADNIYGAGKIDALRAFLRGDSISVQKTPEIFTLAQNYPNPFNLATRQTTTIEYTVPPERQGVVIKLEVFNLLGQKIKTLVNKLHEPNRYQKKWDGTDHQGQNVATGIYLIRLQSANFSQVRKMLLVR